jgi:hypothetical protein
MKMSLALALAMSAIIGGCATQNQGSAPVIAAAGIPFVQFGNIFTWQADGEKGIYIESRQRQWYYATFIMPCRNLPFEQERIGFRTTPTLPLDKFDSIVVDGEPCYFQTFDKVAGPPGAAPAKPANAPPA